MTAVLHILILFGMPLLIRWLAEHIQPFRFLGTTITCFLVGVLYASVVPMALAQADLTKAVYEPLVPLGIAIVLFSTQIARWLRLSFKVILSYMAAVVSIMLTSAVAFYLIGDRVAEPAHYAAMMAGTYIGGTPNMSAVQTALQVDKAIFTQAFLSDVAMSSIYLVFVMIFAQRILKIFMQPYKSTVTADDGHEEIAPLASVSPAKRIRNITISLVAGILVMGTALGGWYALHGSLEHIDMAYLMITITLLGVAASFIAPLRKMPGNYETGDYLFAVFFMALGSLTDFQALLHVNGYYMLFTAIVLFGGLALHILLGYLLRIDHDTLVITSAAGIMSPPFIPAIAGALKNRELVVPGIAAGIIGLAAGNVLGILMGKLLGA